MRLTNQQLALKGLQRMPANTEFTARELADSVDGYYKGKGGLTTMEATMYLVQFRSKGLVTYRRVAHRTGYWSKKNGAKT